MNKHGIRLISFILALFSFIMIFQNLMNDQQQLPLGTTEQLVLNIAETGTTKEQLISELDNITNKHNATLVKVVIPSDEYFSKKHIISCDFGLKSRREMGKMGHIERGCFDQWH